MLFHQEKYNDLLPTSHKRTGEVYGVEESGVW